MFGIGKSNNCLLVMQGAIFKIILEGHINTYTTNLSLQATFSSPNHLALCMV